MFNIRCVYNTGTSNDVTLRRRYMWKSRWAKMMTEHCFSEYRVHNICIFPSDSCQFVRAILIIVLMSVTAVFQWTTIIIIYLRPKYNEYIIITERARSYKLSFDTMNSGDKSRNRFIFSIMSLLLSLYYSLHTAKVLTWQARPFFVRRIFRPALYASENFAVAVDSKLTIISKHSNKTTFFNRSIVMRRNTQP